MIISAEAAAGDEPAESYQQNLLLPSAFAQLRAFLARSSETVQL